MKAAIAYIIGRPAAAAAALALGCLLLYGGTLEHPFHYDDQHSIVDNPHVRQLGNIPAFFVEPGYFSADANSGMYRPMLMVSWALNYAWSGYEPWSYHLVNIAVHFLCGLLVWQILRRLAVPPCMAYLGGLLFVFHPLATEPVNYISSRSESLAALGVLAAFWLYTRPGTGSLWLALAAGACGMLTKSTAVVLPALLWLYEGQRGGERRRTWPFWLLSAVYVLVLRGVGFLGEELPERPRGAFEQFLTQAKAVVFYLKMCFVPTGLNIDHAFASGHPGQWAVYLALALGGSLAWYAWRSQKKLPIVYLGLGWFAVALSPTLVVPLNVLVNEHRLYLPLAGLIIALVSLRPLERLPGLAWGIPLGLVLLGGLVLGRNAVWADRYGLWADAAQKNPTLVRPYIFMGNYAAENERFADAERHYRQALERDANNLSARNNLANLYRRTGRLDQAESLYLEMLAESPTRNEVRYNLAKLYLESGRADAARRHFLQVDADNRHRNLALNNLGVLHQKAGRLDSALHYYVAALRHTPQTADARRNLDRLLRGVEEWAPALLEGGQAAQVETVCRYLLQQAPASPPGLFFLAVSLFKQGRYEESIAVNEKLVAARPEDYFAAMQLANAYEAVGRRDDAAGIYRRLVERNGDAEAGRRLAALRRGQP